MSISINGHLLALVIIKNNYVVVPSQTDYLPNRQMITRKANAQELHDYDRVLQIKSEDISQGYSSDNGLQNMYNDQESIEALEKSYACQVCWKSFILECDLKEHELLHTEEKPSNSYTEDLKKNELGHTDEKPFTCKFCSKSFTEKTVWSHHEQTHTGDNQCDVCFKMLSRATNLAVHKRLHTGEKPYTCRFCLQRFAQVAGLRSHEQRIHCLEKPFTCKFCPKSYVLEKLCRAHERRHTGDKPFGCRFCRKLFYYKPSVKFHERTRHAMKLENQTVVKKVDAEEDQTITCTACGKKFAFKSDLKRHEKKHTGEKPFACKICAQTFVSESYRNGHERKHTGEKPFSCKFCPKSFFHKRACFLHEQRRHTKTYRKKTELKSQIIIEDVNEALKCPVCWKQFGFKSDFKTHERSHTGEKPFTCKFCLKSFSSKSYGNRHVRKHHEFPISESSANDVNAEQEMEDVKVNEVFFETHRNKTKLKKRIKIEDVNEALKCPVCWKQFEFKSDFKIHERSHTGEKPFTCKFCQISFSSKSYGNRHVRKHHEFQISESSAKDINAEKKEMDDVEIKEVFSECYVKQEPKSD